MKPAPRTQSFPSRARLNTSLGSAAQGQTKTCIYSLKGVLNTNKSHIRSWNQVKSDSESPVLLVSWLLMMAALEQLDVPHCEQSGVMQPELTVVSWEEQGQEAGPSAQGQGQHGGWTASQANHWDQEAGCLRKAGEELSKEHVHAERTDVHTDSKIGQSRCCAREEKKKK